MLNVLAYPSKNALKRSLLKNSRNRLRKVIGLSRHIAKKSSHLSISTPHSQRTRSLYSIDKAVLHAGQRSSRRSDTNSAFSGIGSSTFTFIYLLLTFEIVFQPRALVDLFCSPLRPSDVVQHRFTIAHELYGVFVIDLL